MESSDGCSGARDGGSYINNTTTYGGDRSTINTTMINNQQQIPITNTNIYRSQVPVIFQDQTTVNYHHHQISQSFIGKRTLVEFQNNQHQLLKQQQQQQFMNQNPTLANMLMRSVKPRIYQSSTNLSQNFPSFMSQQQQQRFGGGSISSSTSSALIQQLRSGPGRFNLQVNNNNPNLYVNNNNALQSQDSEKIMNRRLQELEKLLDNDDGFENDDVAGLTKNANSEWSETIHSLFSSGAAAACSSPNTNPVSPSPTSSCSSSMTVSSSPGPYLGCSKHVLMEAASAIAEGKTEVINEIFTRTVTTTPPGIGSNAEQMVTEYLLLALKSRVNPFENPPPVAELYGKEHIESTQLLYELSPCFKLGFMAANLAILESILEHPNNSNSFHVVDFGIGQGEQYMNLLNALSSRQKGKTPTVLKITAVADNENDGRLVKVGENLGKFAEDVGGVNLRFNVIVLSQKLEDLSRESLGCDPDEPLAVNFAFKLYKIPDESVSIDNPRDALLRCVKGLSPLVVTVIEQEMNTNTAPFMGRVTEACNYYGALLDSIESSVQRENPDRVKVEEGLSRRLANSVACEGGERVERCEVFGKWRARLGMAGFEMKKMSSSVAESMLARLVSGNRVNPGFTVKVENGGVCFGWMGKTLTVASAWR